MENKNLQRLAISKPGFVLIAGLFIALMTPRANSLGTFSNQFRLLPFSGAQSSTVSADLFIGVATTPLDSAYAYPVPFVPARGHSAINFSNLTDGAMVKIYTIMGEVVKELTAPMGATSVQWDVRNGQGSAVASGVYLYQIKNDRFEKRGKLMIIR